MNAPIPPLPALRCLGDLADVRPVVIVDTREQTPLVFTRLASERGTLSTGDYSFAGGQELFAIERKSIPDLVACCMGDNRDRLCRELHRLRGYRFKRLLVVGTRAEIEAGTYRSRITPAAVLSTLSTIEARYDVAVVFAATPCAAAREVERWAYWFARELVVTVNALARASGLTLANHSTDPRTQSNSLGLQRIDSGDPTGTSHPPGRGGLFSKDASPVYRAAPASHTTAKSQLFHPAA